MAGAKEYWFEVHQNNPVDKNVPSMYSSCIFQQQWYEYCKMIRRNWWIHGFRIQHVEYLTRILLDSLLNKDFVTSARIITALCGSIKRLPELIWRTGCQVLMSLHGNYTRTIQFFKYVFMLCYPQQEEILLNFVMYLVQHHKNLTEAYELLSSKSTTKPLNTSKLLQGYMGLFEYILWKAKALKQRQSSVNNEGAEVVSRQDDNVAYHGNKALQFFEDLVENDGVWDIFLLRQVELLIVFERFDKAQKVLERYREKNPENPNAHRYLYYFHKRQDSPKSTLLPILQDLFIIDPTSELIEEYCNLVVDNMDKVEQTSSNSVCSALAILFKKLDYNSSKNSLQEWISLAKLLKTCYLGNLTNKEIDAKVKECWEERSDWWPIYHFNESMVTKGLSNHGYDVAIQKAKVAKVLMGEDCKFVRRVNEIKRKEATSSNIKDFETSSSCSGHLLEMGIQDLRKKLKRKTGLNKICQSSPQKKKKDTS